MKLMIVVAVILAVGNAKKCPNLSVVDNFDSTKYLGTWYEHARTVAASAAEWFGSCSKAEYSWDNETNTIHVINSDKLFFKTFKLEGHAVLADPSKTEGKLNVTLKTPGGVKTTSDWVLATDYDTFAISYNCGTILGARIEYVWLMSRKQVLSADEQILFNIAVAKAFDKIEAEGGPKQSSLKLTNQKKC